MKIIGFHIKNFRSLVNVEIVSNNLNIFVGLNDSGKSNVLKALNLFFNNETEINMPFDFSVDYSKFAQKGSKQADEISIQLRFFVPETFVDSGVVIWTKKWRKSGFSGSVFAREDKQDFTARSRVKTALERIKYRYVPAVKSDAYFKTLLETLYTSLFMKKNNKFDVAANEYSLALVENTKGISEIVKRSIGIDSLLKVPSNQSEIFKALQFETDLGDNKTVELDYRGDGIKSRHIPAILKFIVEQERSNKEKYAIFGDTIWGYEEPENGIELSRCYEMAEEFTKYSSDIQIFITTHSPAFYTLKCKENTFAFFVKKPYEQMNTTINKVDECDFVDKEMGLMPLIEPHISKYVKEINRYEDLVLKSGLIDIDTIFVEGKTDEKYLLKAFEILNPEMLNRINERTLRIFTKEGRGGVNSLRDWIFAWSFTQHISKAMGVFDNDVVGRTAKKELDKSARICDRNEKYPIKTILIPDLDSIKIMRKDIDMNLAIEHLFSFDVWKKLERFTEVADDKYIAKIRCLPRDLSYDEHLEYLIPDEKLRYLINRKVSSGHKNQFCDNVLVYADSSLEIFNDFSELVAKISEFFITS